MIDLDFLIPDNSVIPAKLSQPLTLLSPASPSGVSVVDYAIPSWVTVVVVSLSGISLSGTDNLNFRLGSSGAPKATGYLGVASNLENGLNTIGSNISTTFPVLISNAANVLHGSIFFTLVDRAANTWTANGNFSSSAFTISFLVSGSVSLDGTLDIVRIFAPSNTFDAGKINVEYV